MMHMTIWSLTIGSDTLAYINQTLCKLITVTELDLVIEFDLLT